VFHVTLNLDENSDMTFEIFHLISKYSQLEILQFSKIKYEESTVNYREKMTLFHNRNSDQDQTIHLSIVKHIISTINFKKMHSIGYIPCKCKQAKIIPYIM